MSQRPRIVPSEQQPSPERPEQQPGPERPGDAIEHPAKLLRIASMIRELLDEVRQASLDEGGRRRLAEIHSRALEELKDVLSDDLKRELDALTVEVSRSPSESEIRVAQAQLVGWLEGLFHGIQAALWAQQAMARAQFEELRRRGLPSGMHGGEAGRPGGGDQRERPTHPGQYL